MEVPNVESVAVDMEVPNVEPGAVDIDITFKKLLACKDKGEVLAKRSSPTISMVPSAFRDLSPSSFDPKVVSIGPLHRKDERLKVFEDEKQLYFHRWLQLNNLVQEQMLRKYSKKVIHSIERIKECYGGSMTYSDAELATMMVIDGCFILMFLYDKGTKDHKFITPTICHDLLLIENQIPYFVLENIMSCTRLGSRGTAIIDRWPVTRLIKLLLGICFIFESKIPDTNVSQPSTPHHILGFIHTYYQPTKTIRLLCIPDPKGHSAMELHRAGMKFKPYADEDWAMTINLKLRSPLISWFPTFMAFPPFSWFRWPTLTMPKMLLGDDTELILRNLIMYEQSITEGKKYVTSYAAAMDMLVDTPEDVGQLVKSGVINSFLGSNEDGANMINNLCKDLAIVKFCYGQQWIDMDTYYNSSWPHTLAGLKRTYFNNPWSIIALCAALVLFALTIVQTIFSIKAA